MSTGAKHTPGPWSCKILRWKSYHEVPEISIYNADGQEFIRQSYDTYSDQATLSESDAYLIAAAPEMLEALEVLCNFKRDCPCELSNEELAAWDKARAAIAKAKGETP
jgi:hypothetical protein